MLELLQARPGLTGVELADRLGVDERTVRRYAARLGELGVPVAAGRGRYGGYRLTPGYRLPPLMLSDAEAVAVVLGLVAGRRAGLPGDAVESALAKVERVLPDAVRDRVRALRDVLGFTAAARDGDAPRTGVLLALAAACEAGRRVRIAYRDRTGAATERDVDPHGIVLHGGRWYVTGHDHRSGERRTFRVDRVVSAETTGPATTTPPADPVAAVADALAAVPYAHDVEVLLHSDAEAVRRRVPPTVATLRPTPDGTLLNLSTNRLDGAAFLLASLGVPFTVRRPDALRDAVRAVAATLRESAER